MDETAVPVVGEIISNLGGTMTAETLVPALEELKDVIGTGIADPEVVAEAVDAWLDEHPEATTTVQDGSITYAKLASDAHYMTTDEVLALYE